MAVFLKIPPIMLLIGVFILFPPHEVDGLECYQCKQCNVPNPATIMTCPAGNYSCATEKTAGAIRVDRSCVLRREESECNFDLEFTICFCNTDLCNSRSLEDDGDETTTEEPCICSGSTLQIRAVILVFMVSLTGLIGQFW